MSKKQPEGHLEIENGQKQIETQNQTHCYNK